MRRKLGKIIHQIQTTGTYQEDEKPEEDDYEGEHNDYERNQLKAYTEALYQKLDKMEEQLDDQCYEMEQKYSGGDGYADIEARLNKDEAKYIEAYGRLRQTTIIKDMVGRGVDD